MKKKTQHWKKVKALLPPEVLPAPPKFPKRIFVKFDDTLDSILDDLSLLASENTNGFEEGDRVAVYEWVETRTMKVTRQLT